MNHVRATANSSLAGIFTEYPKLNEKLSFVHTGSGAVHCVAVRRRATPRRTASTYTAASSVVVVVGQLNVWNSCMWRTVTVRRRPGGLKVLLHRIRHGTARNSASTVWKRRRRRRAVQTTPRGVARRTKRAVPCRTVLIEPGVLLQLQSRKRPTVSCVVTPRNADDWTSSARVAMELPEANGV